jgi:hypothetical protein
MTTKNVTDFLQGFSIEDLKDRGVLRGTSNQLKALSIGPLIALMKEHSVDSLEYPSRNWFLDVEGNFKNPASQELKEGKITDLSNLGSVFSYTNTTINPYYEGSHVSTETESETQLEEAEEITFRLENDLQAALRRNIEQLESGLNIVDGGNERTVEGGRIDIIAEDRSKRLVVIELKAGMARPESIAQTLAYMASLQQEEKRPVKGILVAAGFHPRVILASQAVPNLQLKEYSFAFSFRDR